MKMAHNYFNLEDWLVDSPRKTNMNFFHPGACLSFSFTLWTDSC